MPLFYSPIHKVSIDDLFELMRSVCLILLCYCVTETEPGLGC